MTTVDLAFPVLGTTLPLDHGYALYGAVSRVLGPNLHDEDGVGLFAVRGMRAGSDELHLGDGSYLRIRMPAAAIPMLLAPAGKRLDVDGHTVRLGPPRTYAHGVRVVSAPARWQVQAMTPDRLLAKSWKDAEAIPSSLFLPGHLDDVHAAAVEILRWTGDRQLAALNLDAARWRARFRCVVRLAAAVHDLGKANDSPHARTKEPPAGVTT